MADAEIPIPPKSAMPAMLVTSFVLALAISNIVFWYEMGFTDRQQKDAIAKLEAKNKELSGFVDAFLTPDPERDAMLRCQGAFIERHNDIPATEAWERCEVYFMLQKSTGKENPYYVD